MDETQVSEAKRRLLDRLKLGTATTAGDLARGLGLTDVAVRQHLLTLEQHGLVLQQPTAPQGRGRPAVMWSLTDLAQSLFPERHAELTVGLIEATRQAVGEEGLGKILDVRAQRQTESYRKTLPPESAPLGKRVEALAVQRTAEGYMAQVFREANGVYVLIEHHCPICDAAKCCLGLCTAELDVFRRVLGPDVSVERTEHLLSGDHRCVYRISELNKEL